MNYSYGDAGSDLYTPTKLEWLVTELNARYRQGELFDLEWEISFTAVAPDTIEIVCQGKNAPYRTNQLNDAVSRASELAKAKGWNWVQIIKAEVPPPPPTEADKYAAMSNERLIKLKVELKEQMSEPVQITTKKYQEFSRIEHAYKSATNEESMAAIADEYNAAKKVRAEESRIRGEQGEILRNVERELEKRFPGGPGMTAEIKPDNLEQAEIAKPQLLPSPKPGTQEYYDQFVKGKYYYMNGVMKPFNTFSFKSDFNRALRGTIAMPGTLEEIMPDGRVLLYCKDRLSSGVEEEFYALISLVKPTTNIVGDTVSYRTVIDEKRLNESEPEKNGRARITTSTGKEVSAFLLAECDLALPTAVSFEQYIEVYNQESSLIHSRSK